MHEKDENDTKSGFYRHKDTGVVVELVNDPDLGSPLTNAYIQAGFEYVGDTAPDPKAGALYPDTSGVAPKTAAELRKELEEAEARERAVKPLNKQNKAELVATAEAEGVELPENEPTNKELAELIQSKRDKGEDE